MVEDPVPDHEEPGDDRVGEQSRPEKGPGEDEFVVHFVSPFAPRQPQGIVNSTDALFGQEVADEIREMTEIFPTALLIAPPAKSDFVSARSCSIIFNHP